MVVIFISSAPLNSTACYFVTLDIIANYRVTMANGHFIDRIQVIMSNCKEKSRTYNILGKAIGKHLPVGLYI